MSTSARVIRWILLLPAVYLAWQFALFTGIGLFALAESQCPEEYMDSGLCTAEWFRWVEAIIFSFGAALAATLMVLTGAWVAPAHRGTAATAIFVGGFLLAAYVGWATNAWVPFVAAVVAGAITLWLVMRSFSNRTVSSS